jgi:hypothetical protein
MSALSNVLFIEIHIYHADDKQARYLAQGEHVLFGGKVCIVEDCQFVDDVHTNDVKATLATIYQDGTIKRQDVTVDREFEFQTLGVAPYFTAPDKGEQSVSG